MPTPPEAFIREAQADIDALTAGLVDLDRQDSDTVDEVFRTAHTLKSNCGLVGLEGARELAHALEDVLEAVRAGHLQPSESVIEETLAAADDLDLIITAAATGADHDVDYERRSATLRELVATHADDDPVGGRNETDSEGVDDQGSTATDHQATTSEDVDPDGSEWDSDVAAALEDASRYDDLEGLAADVEVTDDESLEDWGRLTDLTNSEEVGSPDSPAEEVGSSTAGPASPESESDTDDHGATEAPEDVIDDPPTFDQLKEDVDRDSDIDRLQADIEQAEFGEFDDEDDLTIEELIDVPPAGEVESEADDVGADLAPGQIGSSSGDGEAPETSPDSEGETASTSFSEVKEQVSMEDDLDRLESDIEEAEFGEFDDEDDLSIAELVDADPAELDPDRPGAESAGATANDDLPDTPESSDVELEPDADQSKPADGPDSRPEEVAADPSTDRDIGSPADEVAGPVDTSDRSVSADTDADSSAVSTSDQPDAAPEADSAGDRSPEDAVGDADATDAIDNETPPAAGPDSDGEAGTGGGTADAEPDPFGVNAGDPGTTEESEIDADFGDPFGVTDGPSDDESDELIPDVEGTLFSDSDSEAGGSQAQADDIDVDVDFGGDAGLESFESRFGDLFDDSPGTQDPSPAYDQAVETIAASSFDETQLATTEPPGDERRTERSGAVTVAPETADALLNYIEQLSTGQRRLERELTGTDATVAEILSDLRTATAGLRETVRQVRLTPLSTVAERLPRAARRTARDTDKQVSVELSGTDVTLDRGVVDRLGDPLTHLVRNAVAHGIEPPDERETADKPGTGTVELRAEHDGDRVTIEVEDDGRGLDIDAIADAAVEEELLDEDDAESLTAEEAADLVCQPGLSTATEVSETSGRGVGMDVVVQAVAELNGELAVETEPGSGTLVRLQVPVSVAVTEVLFVEAADRWFAIPASAVEQVGVPTGVETEDGTEYVTVDPIGEAPELEGLSASGLGDVDREADGSERATSDRLPMLRLAESFDLPTSGGTEGAVVQLRSEAREAAILCDRVGELREVVITPYERILGGTPGVSGVTTHGDGRLVNVLDVTTL